MIYNDKQLVQIYNYWQTKKYPQHLKQLIFDYVAAAMSYIPKMPELEIDPSGVHLEATVKHTSNPNRLNETEVTMFMEVNRNVWQCAELINCEFWHEIKLKYRSIHKYKATPEQLLEFKLYCIYKYYKSEGVRIYLNKSTDRVISEALDNMGDCRKEKLDDVTFLIFY